MIKPEDISNQQLVDELRSAIHDIEYGGSLDVVFELLDELERRLCQKK